VEEEEETAMVAEGGRGQYTDIIAPDIAQQHLYMYLSTFVLVKQVN
jgi:hypothetical protein